MHRMDAAEVDLQLFSPMAAESGAKESPDIEKAQLEQLLLPDGSPRELWGSVVSAACIEQAAAFDTVNTPEWHAFHSGMLFYCLLAAKNVRIWPKPLATATSGTPPELLPLSRFAGICGLSERRLFDLELLKRENRNSKSTRAVVQMLYRQLGQTCAELWRIALSSREQGEGWDLLMRYWPCDEVLCDLAKTSYWNYVEWVEALGKTAFFQPKTGKPVKTIGIFYFTFSNGGVQRVISLQCEIWRRLGYRIVLITEEKPTPDDYPLHSEITRLVVPTVADPSELKQRFAFWEKAQAQYQFDCVVYHAWYGKDLFWDLSFLKSKDIAVIGVCHSVFTIGMMAVDRVFAVQPTLFRLFDTLITLSATNECYYASFGVRAITIANPTCVEFDRIQPAPLTDPNIIWVGRFSPEKRLEQVLDIFALVAQKMPNAHLMLVGKANDSTYEQMLLAKVRQLQLENSVEFCGYHVDLTSFYQRASVHLLTSAYEGSPMVLIESKSFGIPCVLYDLPYLDILRQCGGYLAVPQNDIRSAADTLLQVLQDSGLRQKLGREARESMEWLRQQDIPAAWKNLFDHGGVIDTAPLRQEDFQMVLRTILEANRCVVTRWRERTVPAVIGVPKLSIVVPVHNMARYLEECLDSILFQSLKELEVICIDDASTDQSPLILAERARRDPRLKVITYPVNRSASQARKDGVLAATGRYLLFVDVDDRLMPGCCERLFAEMLKNPVDILHFGTTVIAQGGAAASQELLNFLKPYPGKLSGKEIQNQCFRKDSLGYTLWNKMFSMALAKKAFGCVQDGNFSTGQDLYAFFLLSYFANSYRGSAEIIGYCYRCGSGISTVAHLSLSQFLRYCQASVTPQAVHQFLVKHEESEEEIEFFDTFFKNKFLSACVEKWAFPLEPSAKQTGLSRMLECFSLFDVASMLFKFGFWRFSDYASDFNGYAFPCKVQSVKTIGIHYIRYGNGGTERVISLLISIYLQAGYRVVLLTDVEPSLDDYALPEEVIRVVLPPSNGGNFERFQERWNAWQTAIDEYEIDLVLYNAWYSAYLFWDLLAVKSAGILFTMVVHGLFAFKMHRPGNHYLMDVNVFRLCDRVAVLSRTNEWFYQTLGVKTQYLPNPCTFTLDEIIPSTLETPTVIWIGRFGEEKRPMDAIEIFARVAEALPQARLLMVGKGECPENTDVLKARVDALGLTSQVHFCGYHVNVNQFYTRSSVHLMTSIYEGFPMVLTESKAFGIPCVLYDLPYLELLASGKGYIAVPQQDMVGAADAVIRLLTDRDLLLRYGREARESIEPFVHFKFKKEWRNFFRAAAGGDPDSPDTVGSNHYPRLALEAIMEANKEMHTRVTPLLKQQPITTNSAQVQKQINQLSTELQRRIEVIDNSVVAPNNLYFKAAYCIYRKINRVFPEGSKTRRRVMQVVHFTLAPIKRLAKRQPR